jgi:hypothetical protein
LAAQALPEGEKMTFSHLTDLTACVNSLEASGDLVRVRSETDPVHQLAGVAAQFEGKKVLQRERV